MDPHVGLKSSQNRSRRGSGTPSDAQERPRRTQERSRSVRGVPRERPKPPQDRLGSTKRSPKRPSSRPKTAKISAKSPPEAEKSIFRKSLFFLRKTYDFQGSGRHWGRSWRHWEVSWSLDWAERVDTTEELGSKSAPEEAERPGEPGGKGHPTKKTLSNSEPARSLPRKH